MQLVNWTSGQKPHLIQHGRKIDRNTANHVPFAVLGLSTSSSRSSSPTPPTSSSQEVVTPTEHFESTRSESMSEEVRGNSSHGPAETEEPNKNDDNKEVRGNSSHHLPECLEEFKDILVDESVPEHRDASSSSHELPSESRAKVVSGEHSIFTHFLKLKYLLEKFLQKTHWYGRDLVTADHKVRSEGCQISNLSSIRCSGTRLGNTVHTIIPM